MNRMESRNLRHVEEHLVIDQIAGDQQVLADVTHALLQRKTVSTHDDGGVDRQVNEVQTVLRVTQTTHNVLSAARQRR